MGKVRKRKVPARPAFAIRDWMDISCPDATARELVVLRERSGTRALAEPALREVVKDHLAELAIIRRIGGYRESLAYVRNKMPTRIEIRSGDCAEILATEYIEQCTRYSVPIKRLRWKDDRDTAMRGDDVIALRQAETHWHLLKAESKSRESLTPSVVQKAVVGLGRHNGRPNPSSLAFISSRLRAMGRDAEAAVFESLQSRTPRAGEIEHLIFTLSGNDPCSQLRAHLAEGGPSRRHLVGCIIPDHQGFIDGLFDAIVSG